MRREIEKTKQVLHELHNLREGVVKDPLLSVLREVYIYKLMLTMQVHDIPIIATHVLNLMLLDRSDYVINVTMYM